ncbi:hypothetical protein AB0H42_04320 [Nocardia sp. NPDC050799]|uniref:hypothetical protein n=1 Tax=Nocardia sp. NPDC050799 TaxID=3154842 RepID=UPI0033D55521
MTAPEIPPAYICERKRNRYTGIRYTRVRCPHCRVRHWTPEPTTGTCPRTGQRYQIAVRPRVFDPWEGVRDAP